VCCFVFRKNNVGKVVNSLNSTVNNNISENWISTGILLVSSQFDIEIEININLYISEYIVIYNLDQGIGIQTRHGLK
jgi:hypothetical protein